MSRALVLWGALILLTVASLGLKYNSVPASIMQAMPGISDVEAVLTTSGFEIQRVPDNNDPQWLIGAKGACEVRFANVSAQGWHRQAVALQAGTDRLSYLYGGAIYDAQPVLKTQLANYLRRLKGYFGIADPPIVVRAVILGQGCAPDMFSTSELKSLS